MAAPKNPRVVLRWPRPSAQAMAKDTIGWWGREYIRWIRERNLSERTAKLRTGYLDNFAAWCEARNLYYPGEITRPILDRYQSTLFHYRTAAGKPLSFSAQFSRLVAVRVFFKWLMKRQVIVANPASELDLPRVPHQLPRHVLNVHEVEAVIRQPNVDDVLGLRDRAMMELLYATGIRRSELVRLKVFDLDAHRQTLFIREGKGLKDRVVPVGERALAWFQKYLDDARPELVPAVDDGSLFLTVEGNPMTLSRATDLVGGYVDQAKLGKRGACHLFRHSCATAMLEGGADLRYIQHMLGHADVSTTQVYTSVSIHALKEVHARCHPGASLKPRAASAKDQQDGPELTAGEVLQAIEAEEHDGPIDVRTNAGRKP